MKPIEKVALEMVNGYLQVRVYGSRFQHGYTTGECVKMQTGKAIPEMRKHAIAKAKLLGVPFEDLLTL
jgi:hypothetical protein